MPHGGRFWAGNDLAGGAVFWWSCSDLAAPAGTVGGGEPSALAFGCVPLEQLAPMERWLRALAAVRPEPVAVAAAAISAVLIVGAFAVAVSTSSFRPASLAAAGTFLLLVAIGVSLYAWRLGGSGRSD